MGVGHPEEAECNTAAQQARSVDKRKNRGKAGVDSRPDRLRGSVLQLAVSNWQSWQPGPRQCRLKTPPAWRSPCGIGSPRDSHFHSHPGARCTNGAPFRCSIGWSCRKCRSSGSHSPTAILEHIAQDMYILNWSCGEEIVRSSLARARRAAPKKRRPARRNRVRPVKQACSDTTGETISSTDEVAPQRKRAQI